MEKRNILYFTLYLGVYLLALIVFHAEIAGNLFLFLCAIAAPLFSTAYLFFKLKKLYKEVNAHTLLLEHCNLTLTEQVKNEIEKNAQRDKMILHQNKMAAMGEMISNIAHQWRQPLSAISTAASAMKLQKELKILSDETFDYSYEMMMKNAEFLSQTINSFRDFFSIDKEKTHFDLAQTIAQNIELVNNRLVENNIKIYPILAPNLTLNGYKNEFMQVMINILNNAIDALKVKSVSTSKIITVHTHIENNHAIIIIRDSAGGIKENIKEKIFEPYFTTKHQAQGTGIGLYMTQEILVNHMNGTIECENRSFFWENKDFFGAEFKLTIPLIH